MKQYLKDKNFRAGLFITGVMILVILIGLFWTPYDPNAMNGSAKLQGPSAAHWFGTDNFGRDIFSRVVQGAGATFLIAAATVAIGLLVGLIVAFAVLTFVYYMVLLTVRTPKIFERVDEPDDEEDETVTLPLPPNTPWTSDGDVTAVIVPPGASCPA